MRASTRFENCPFDPGDEIFLLLGQYGWTIFFKLPDEISIFGKQSGSKVIVPVSDMAKFRVVGYLSVLSNCAAGKQVLLSLLSMNNTCAK